jgi:hypothetical protein
MPHRGRKIDYEAARRRDLVHVQGSERASLDFDDRTPEEKRAARPVRLAREVQQAVEALRYELAANTRAFARLEIEDRERLITSYRARAKAIGDTAGRASPAASRRLLALSSISASRKRHTNSKTSLRHRTTPLSNTRHQAREEE